MRCALLWCMMNILQAPVASTLQHYLHNYLIEKVAATVKSFAHSGSKRLTSDLRHVLHHVAAVKINPHGIAIDHRSMFNRDVQYLLLPFHS